MEEQIRHNEIEIKSVAQFLNKVTKICINKDEIKLQNVFFRGEADVNWKTVASLLRDDLCSGGTIQSDVYVQLENQLIDEAKIYNPQLFESCHNSIDKLVEMQHYGLPTRLLDVTTNPLIALYFACESTNADGRVLYIKQKPVPGDLANLIATLCEFYKSDIYEHHSLSTFLKILKEHNLFQEDENYKVCFLFEYITKSFLYVHPYINERMKAQKGAFVFSAFMQPFLKDTKYNKLLKRMKRSKVTGEELDSISFDKTSVSFQFEKKHFIIRKDDKKRILKELDLIGINEAFVYPEPEHQMRTVKERVVMSNMTKEQFYS